MHCYFLYSFWRIIYVKLTFYLFYFRVIPRYLRREFTSRKSEKIEGVRVICMQLPVCLHVILISYYNFSFLQLIFMKSLWVESIYQCNSAIAECPMGVAEIKRLILPSMISESILRLTVVRLRDRSFILAVTSPFTSKWIIWQRKKRSILSRASFLKEKSIAVFIGGFVLIRKVMSENTLKRIYYLFKLMCYVTLFWQ